MINQQNEAMNRYTQLSEEIQGIILTIYSDRKDILKKTQLDLRLIKDHIIHNDKKVVQFQNQINTG